MGRISDVIQFKYMNRRGVNKIIIATTVAFIFIATVFVLTKHVPEYNVYVSDDGNVEMHSTLSKVSIFKIHDDKYFNSKLISPIYKISVDGGGEIYNAEVFFNVRDLISDEFNVSDLVIYTFDEDLNTWIVQSSVFDINDSVISAHVGVLKNKIFSVGYKF